MTEHDLLNELLDDLESNSGRAYVVSSYMAGVQPAAYLSTESRLALSSSLSRLGVNFPRLVVSSQADRLHVNGFTRAGMEGTDTRVWELWRSSGMWDKCEALIADRLAYGRAYVTVWSVPGDRRRPMVFLDSPRALGVKRDPLTGEVVASVRRWDAGGASHALVLTDTTVAYWIAQTSGQGAGGGWRRITSQSHGLRVCPTVEFARRTSADDVNGTSVIEDIVDLSDALNKLLADMMVTSEEAARPKRWATGLEVMEDTDGNPVNPFGAGRFLQSESPDTKFGQLPGASLDTYTGAIQTIQTMIGGLSGLPPHYLGVHGTQPANAESVRATEAQMTSKAFSEQRGMDTPLGRVGALLLAVADGVDPRTVSLLPEWDDPEIRTPGQAADAAAKLSGIGVGLSTLLTEVMHWTPERAEKAVTAARTDAVTRAAASMGRA